MYRLGFLLHRLVLAAALAFASSAALAGTITVITSFPKELTAAYKAAFEKANPDIKVEILNKNTVAGIAFVRETAAGQRPDVFWASAPDAFEVLKRDSLLQVAPDVDNTAIPAKIGSYPINDPKGFYKGQALAGYGIMYNTRYLKANKLAAPTCKTAICRPHCATASASNSLLNRRPSRRPRRQRDNDRETAGCTRKDTVVPGRDTGT